MEDMEKYGTRLATGYSNGTIHQRYGAIIIDFSFKCTERFREISSAIAEWRHLKDNLSFIRHL